MADGKQFEFLLSSWGVEASAAAQEEITENVEKVNRKAIEDYIKESDIRKLKLSSNLPKDLARMGDGQLPPGKYLCQVTKFADMTQPTKFQEEGDKKWRLLSLSLCDSEQKFTAIEYMHIQNISSDSWPGTKLLLWSTEQAPLLVRNSHLLLTPDTVEVLGGEVWKLIENWKASKEVEATRLAWRTDGVKKQVAGQGAPPWIEFDPKKARNISAKQAEAERAAWLQSGTKPNVQATGDDEAGGTRFQVAEFREEAAPAVHSKVSASAFKAVIKGEGKGKGKGKDRDGDDKGGGKGKGKSRSRGGDDEYQEEKRAPSHSSLGLAAFIKPTKDGKLPDEALDLLTSKTPSKPAVSAGGGGGAAAGGWADDGWGESATSWGASSWDEGGAGWSGSSGGYGGGGGRGGGGKSGGRGKGGGGKGKGGGGKSKGGGKGGGSRGGW